MIPVQEQPEPADFVLKVQTPGKDFLHRVPHPTNWSNHDYWRDALPDLCKAYSSICAYAAHWIPPSTGVASVDHFVPKETHPQLAVNRQLIAHILASGSCTSAPYEPTADHAHS